MFNARILRLEIHDDVQADNLCLRLSNCEPISNCMCSVNRYHSHIGNTIREFCRDMVRESIQAVHIFELYCLEQLMLRICIVDHSI